MQDLADLHRRARLGQVGAMTELGKRLLVGMEAPREPQTGAEFLRAAADKDGAEACALVSVLLAADAPAGDRWSQSLDYLTRAAELGDVRSRDQLALIASDAEMAARAALSADNAPETWRALRRSVNLNNWMSAASMRPVRPSPLIATADAFLSAPICSWLIKRATGLLKTARTYDSATASAHDDLSRSNRAAQFNIIEADVILLLVRARIAATVRAHPRVLEDSQVLHYSIGQEFKPHYDFLNPNEPALADEIAKNGQRAATFLIYLNDAFDGGETDFPALDWRFKGSTGGALFFMSIDAGGAPNRLTLHAGLPPTRGEKWLFSQWIRTKAASA